ncbi:unnamed protein product, partial [Ceratitis capitata]
KGRIAKKPTVIIHEIYCAATLQFNEDNRMKSKSAPKSKCTCFKITKRTSSPPSHHTQSTVVFTPLPSEIGSSERSPCAENV